MQNEGDERDETAVVSEGEADNQYDNNEENQLENAINTSEE